MDKAHRLGHTHSRENIRGQSLQNTYASLMQNVQVASNLVSKVKFFYGLVLTSSGEGLR